MNDFLTIFSISFLGICAIYGLCRVVDSIIEHTHWPTESCKPGRKLHTPNKEIGYMLIKRDTQGAQASVHFNPDFDLFKYEDGDYIFLEIKVEEVKE